MLGQNEPLFKNWVEVSLAGIFEGLVENSVKKNRSEPQRVRPARGTEHRFSVSFNAVFVLGAPLNCQLAHLFITSRPQQPTY